MKSRALWQTPRSNSRPKQQAVESKVIGRTDTLKKEIEQTRTSIRPP